VLPQEKQNFEWDFPTQKDFENAPRKLQELQLIWRSQAGKRGEQDRRYWDA
jgi:hypothetical protein